MHDIPMSDSDMGSYLVRVKMIPCCGRTENFIILISPENYFLSQFLYNLFLFYHLGDDLH